MRVITNNNHEFMRENEFTEIDEYKKLINGKIPFLFALNDKNTLVVTPSNYDKLKVDIMEKIDYGNKR